MAGKSATAPKKRGFVAVAPPQKKTQRTTVKASELVIGVVSAIPPPPAVAALFEPACELWAAIDIETHELVPGGANSWWREGQFGHMSRLLPAALEELRIVQIGWAVGAFDCQTPVVKSCLVRPDGFAISEAAAMKHGISHELADRDGYPLTKVVLDMLRDVFYVVGRGGRLCCHNLEFDAGILHAEMKRSDFDDHMLGSWHHAVRDGFCSMQPEIGHWVRQQMGMGDREHKAPIRLRDLVEALIPNSSELLLDHHDAGNDALMHWLVARELSKRACSE